MKHRVYGKHLGRNKDQRRTLFKSLVRSLFLHGTIETSQEKAKSIKGLVDKIINFAKIKNRQNLLQSYLKKDLQDRLVKEIVPKLPARVSGYTSLVRLGQRLGDNAMMVRMSLIGVEELKPIEKVTSNKAQVTSKIEIKKETFEKKGRTGRSVRKTTSTKKTTSRLSKTK